MDIIAVITEVSLESELGNETARLAEHGVKGIVWVDTLTDDGPSGGFFKDGEPMNW